MFHFNTEFEQSPHSARYFIVQHIPDVMRKETLNVGVLVQKGETRTARFLGENTQCGHIDGRAIKSIRDAQVYRMWVRHWHKVLAQEGWRNRMLNDNFTTYQLIDGGEVTDTGADSAEDVCSYLFSMLVSHGGLAEAIDAPQEGAEIAGVTESLKNELRKLKIMDSVADVSVRHPVTETRSVRGATEWHHVSFFQEGQNEGFAIEPLNLATRKRKLAKERAGYLSFIFGDIRRGVESCNNNKRVNNIAVVSVNDEDRDDPSVSWCLKIVSDNAVVVEWNNEQQRTEFLKDRERIALAA